MVKDSVMGGSSVAKELFANGATAQDAGGDASGLVQTLQKHVDDIRSLIQCGICMRPLYEPFTLACGHTFCYSCLASWFYEERANKSCPDCRSPVKSQPSPAYLVRSIVHLFTSRAELLGKEETTEGLLNEQQQEAERVNKDKGNTNTGLFQGAFKPRPPIQFPIVDAEDNVVRCPMCSWELEEDSGCTQCGYRRDLDSQIDSNESAQWSEDEENSEMNDYDYFGDGFEEGFQDDIEALEALQSGPNHYTLPWPSFYTEHTRSYGGTRSRPQTINISDDEEDEDEDDYEDAEMDSFIDDDEHDEDDSESASDRSTVVDSHAPSSQVHYNEPQIGSDMPVSQEDDFVDTDEEIDEDNEDDVDDIDVDLDEDEGVERGGDEDGSDEDDDDEEPIRPPVAQRRQPLRPTGPLTRRGATAPRLPNTRPPSTRQRPGREVPRSQQPTATGSPASNIINISDDSDDDDPIIPIRRRGQARNIF